jgi:hypothetical protein
MPYPRARQAWPSNWRNPPIEGDREVPLSIDWAAEGGPNNAVGLNLTDLGPQNFSQIVALYVNNIKSQLDVDFVFPDQEFVLTVPASSEGLYPVATKSLRFIVQLLGTPGPTDFTSFVVYNSYPYPVAVAKSDFTNISSVGGLTFITTVIPPAPQTFTFPLIASGIWGKVISIGLSAVGVEALGADVQVNVELTDGNANVLYATSFFALNGVLVPFINILNLSNLGARFEDGLNLNVAYSTAAGTIISGALNANVYWR